MPHLFMFKMREFNDFILTKITIIIYKIYIYHDIPYNVTYLNMLKRITLI